MSVYDLLKYSYISIFIENKFTESKKKKYSNI